MPRKGSTTRPEGWALVIRRWRNMISRCHNPADVGYKKYSSRGIVVCAEWHKKESFFEYVIANLGLPDESKERQTLDRIDNNKGYEPENIRWAPYIVQVRNKSDNVWVTYLGNSVLLQELAETVNVPVSLLYDRIFRQKWSVEEAVNTRKLTKSERLKERSAKTELRVTYQGRTKLLKHWVKELNLNANLVRERIQRGWSVERSFTAPSDKGSSMRDKAQVFMFNGNLKTVKEIAKECELTTGAILYRVKRGWLGSSHSSQNKDALLANSTPSK